MKGDILVMNATKGGWFSSAQRFFTRMPFTHAALDIGPVLQIRSYFEANFVATIIPKWKYIGDKTVEARAFRPNWNDTEALRDDILKSIYARYAGASYGYTQVLYFVMRWFFKLFGKDIRKWKNPIPNGDICSELVYRYILTYAIRTNKGDLWGYLDEWNENTVHAGDIYTICRRFPQYFQEVNPDD